MKNLKWLHDMGFALHSLHPKSKMPKGLNWQTGPRKSWSEFTKAHAQEDNVGVRTGQPSQLKDGSYLIILDIDVKSSDPEDAKAAYSAAENFLGRKLQGLPTVASGRGGYSLHVYARCMQPRSSFNLIRSPKLVRVTMPSIRPGKKEMQTLTPEEMKAGVRIRAAFEIDVLGTGKQAAMPPSIHPDSGKAYTWKTPIAEHTDMPLVSEAKFKSVNQQKEGKPIEHLAFKEVDLAGLGLSNKALALVMEMEGLDAYGGDRSSALFGVIAEMVLKNFDDSTIVSVLSDPLNAIAEVVIDRVGNNFEKCAAWILPQVHKMRINHSVEKQFDQEPDLLDGTDWAEDFTEANKTLLAAVDAWKTDLDKNSQGGFKMNLKNVSLFLRNSAKVNEWLGHNLFTGEIEFLKAPPWEKKKEDIDCKHKMLADSDIVEARLFLSRKEKFEPNQNLMLEGLVSCAKLNPFHPVRDWLETLEWDGVERIGHWLHNYMGAADTPYTQAVGVKLLCAMLARVYRPGCKFDFVPILEGEQGIGKSTALRILADPWFCDSVGDITNKDIIQQMQGAWLLEMGELAGMGRADMNAFKDFISRQEDKARLAYQRLAAKFPRQCVFVGSTNDDEYLKDATGNRRFWPVEVTKVSFDELTADCDQLWAEALRHFKTGKEKLYLSGAALKTAHAEIASMKMISDPWDELGAEFVEAERKKMKEAKPGAEQRVSVNDFLNTLGKGASGRTRVDQMRAASVFKKLGFRQGLSNGVRFWRRFL